MVHKYVDKSDDIDLALDLKLAKADMARWAKAAKAHPMKPLRLTWEKKGRLDLLSLLRTVRDERADQPASSMK